MQNYNLNKSKIGNLTVDEFIQELEQRGLTIAPKCDGVLTAKSFLTGSKELAQFLHCAESTIRRKLANHEFDFCAYRTGQVILFDKAKLLDGLKVGAPLVRKYHKGSTTK